MSFSTSKLQDISIIRTGKLDSNAAVDRGEYPFFTCDPVTLHIDKWAYDTEAVLLAGNNASGNYTAKYYYGKFNAYQRTYIIESANKEKLNTRFLCYAINQQLRLLKTMSSGSTTKFLTIKMLHALDIPFPSINIQNRVVEIVSAYDNLIENNQKQIKLLEEAAQRLYKEWFIDLRFPGHESTPIHDGIPEGWSTGSLDDIAEDTGKNVRKENRETYSYYLPIDCLPKKSLSYSVINDISLAESSLISFAPGDILFGAMRPYFHKVVVARDRGLTRSTCFVMNAREPNLWAFLTMLLFSNEAIDYATKISVGTTMPYVRWKDFVNMRIVIPTEPILIQFDSLIKPLIKKAACLAEANMKLEQARDRLLPKLMSGEIEV